MPLQERQITIKLPPQHRRQQIHHQPAITWQLKNLGGNFGKVISKNKRDCTLQSFFMGNPFLWAISFFMFASDRIGRKWQFLSVGFSMLKFYFANLMSLQWLTLLKNMIKLQLCTSFFTKTLKSLQAIYYAALKAKFARIFH